MGLFQKVGQVHGGTHRHYQSTNPRRSVSRMGVYLIGQDKELTEKGMRLGQGVGRDYVGWPKMSLEALTDPLSTIR